MDHENTSQNGLNEIPNQGLTFSDNKGLLAQEMDGRSEDEKRFGGFFANLRSDHTRKEYSYAIREFLALYEGEIHEPRDIQKHHIAHYRNLLEKNYAPNTVLKKMSAISSLCKYLADPAVALLDTNPCFGVNRVEKEVQRETAALTREEVKKMFMAIRLDRYNTLFNKAFLGVGFYGGLRIHEICNLRRKNLGSESGVKILRFTGKRRNVRKVSLHPVAGKYLDDHLRDLEKRGFDMENPDQPLFPNLKKPQQAGPITSSAGDYIFKTILDRAGFVAGDDVRR